MLLCVNLPLNCVPSERCPLHLQATSRGPPLPRPEPPAPHERSEPSRTSRPGPPERAPAAPEGNQPPRRFPAHSYPACAARRVPAEGRPLYLEAISPDSRRLYLRHGFE